jgi:ATP-dependent DNA helicase RecQ
MSSSFKIKDISSFYKETLHTKLKEAGKHHRILVLKGFYVADLAASGYDYILNPFTAADLIDLNKAADDSKVLQKRIASTATKGVLLYEQFQPLAESNAPAFSADDVCIITDNSRSAYPYRGNIKFDDTIDDGIETRPAAMPSCYAETIERNEQVFIRYITSPPGIKELPLFDKTIAVETVETPSAAIIDLEIDNNELDFFISEALEKQQSSVSLTVKSSPKHKYPGREEKLELTNFIFKNTGGELTNTRNEKLINKKYKPSPVLLNLLHEYWGSEASFRELKVYTNPDESKDTMMLSQGQVVETIIAECNNAQSGKPIRDLFLTAPTGSGKSLLFQLPAFHISKLGSVTIIVSPLIALMKDQVNAILNERKFKKVAYLNSELSLMDRERVIDACKTGEIDLLYLSPELLLSYDIGYFTGTRKLGLLIIDEAHLVTTWGKDFRVDYWFLGLHLRKIRKYEGHKFPIVAVTATAVYGGSNDMVFDCIDSLYLSDPHRFTGNIKRDDIKFVISCQSPPDKGYEKFKYDQTVSFCDKVLSERKIKTLVYVPYAKHVDKIYDGLTDESQKSTTKYFGTMDKASKDLSYHDFSTGKKRLMLSTKAFGMGVDISDIQVVYHHAPSGHLADYVQEVGRIARDKDITGYAAINYSEKDTLYTKILHSMSSIKQWQLKEVLAKLSRIYAKEKSNNLLISVDDFAHIFLTAKDVDQKVLTSLMMIEKDYLMKNRFNVIIARPKKLLVKAYARITRDHYALINKKYKSVFHETRYSVNATDTNVYVEINLDALWKNHFSEISFPQLESLFYKGTLFKEQNVVITPQLKIKYSIEPGIADFRARFYKFLELLSRTLGEMSGYFTEEELAEQFRISGAQDTLTLTSQLVAIYSSFSKGMGSSLVDPNAFLQKRADGLGTRYRVAGNLYVKEIASLRSLFDSMFTDNEKTVWRFISKDGPRGLLMVRLGYLLEMIKVTTVGIVGGESSMISVCINDPKQLSFDSENTDYSNYLLEDVNRRHKLSLEIFNHFFLRNLNDKMRWNFIEDYFLGEEVEQLLKAYPGKDPDTAGVDIVSQLPKESAMKLIENNPVKDTHSITFEPVAGQMYYGDNILTLKVGEEYETKKISIWISENPLLLDKAKDTSQIRLDSTSYKILQSKIAQHPEYVKAKNGFNHKIKILPSGPEKPAKTHFEENPAAFYKWYIKNRDYLVLKKIEKIKILLKIKDTNSGLLTKEDKQFLSLK